MSHYNDYQMPFGWGEFDDEVTAVKKVKTIHEISRLPVGGIYIVKDDYDRRRATAHATHLRKKNIMDIKFADGKFTRFK